MENPQISVVLVSFNTRELTLRALEALQVASEDLAVEVWVVDNHSSDGSVAAIEARFPDVNVLASAENLGFGRANNRAMERARGQWIFLLNTDAFVEPDALRQLLAGGERHPRAGVIAPRVLNADGSRQASVWLYPSPMLSWIDNIGLGWLLRRIIPTLRQHHSPDEEGEISWAIGACLMVRREVYDQIGGFDPRFWMYAEETDWQKRMRDAGWQIVLVPDARVTHLGGASGSGPKIVEAFYRSMDLYMLKHFGRAGFWSVRAAMLLGSLLRVPIFSLRAARNPADKGTRAQMRLARWLVRRQWRPLANPDQP